MMRMEMKTVKIRQSILFYWQTAMSYFLKRFARESCVIAKCLRELRPSPVPCRGLPTVQASSTSVACPK